MAIASVADVKVVQRMPGHAHASMTLNTYADLWLDRLDEVAEAVSLHRARALALALAGNSGSAHQSGTARWSRGRFERRNLGSIDDAFECVPDALDFDVGGTRPLLWR